MERPPLSFLKKSICLMQKGTQPSHGPKPEFRKIISEIWLYFERSEMCDIWLLFKEVPHLFAAVEVL
jgi:hypothetical protein